jgi:HemY protein
LACRPRLAEIEEGEHGDQGRVRSWLTRALSAPRDPAWVADGQVFERWSPISPISGRVGAFEWKVVATPPPPEAVALETLRLDRPAIAPPAAPLPEAEDRDTGLIDAVPADGPSDANGSGEQSHAHTPVPALEREPSVIHAPDDPGTIPPPDEEETLPRRRFRLFS